MEWDLVLTTRLINQFTLVKSSVVETSIVMASVVETPIVMSSVVETSSRRFLHSLRSVEMTDGNSVEMTDINIKINNTG